MKKTKDAPEIGRSFKAHEAIVCFMDVRGFSSFARTQMGDLQVGKYIQALLVLFGKYVLSNLPAVSHVKGVGDGLLAIWTADRAKSTRTFFIENIPVALSQLIALHEAVSTGRLAAETQITVSEASPRYLGFGVFVGPIASSSFTMPDNSITTEYFGTAINIAARLQDFSRPTGLTIACVPDFNPALRSAVESVGKENFELIELDSSSLIGVLGEDILQAYSYKPESSPKEVFPDLRERQAIGFDDVKEIEEMLHAPQEGRKVAAIQRITANRLTRFLDDLKAISLNPNEPLQMRNSALASYIIVAGPPGLEVIQKFAEGKNPQWTLLEICLQGIQRYELRKFEPIVIELLKKEGCEDSTLVNGIRCLGAIGSNKSVDFLIQMLDHEDWGIQQIAVEALQNLPIPKKTEVLGRLLLGNSVHDRVRISSAEILGTITSDNSLRILLEAAEKVDEAVLEEVIIALAKLMDSRASTALTRIALDNGKQVRLRIVAVQALGKIQSKESTDALRKLVLDKEEKHQIRGSAIMSLGQLSLHESIPDLCSIAEDDAEYSLMRGAAIATLAELSATALIPIAKKLMSSSNSFLVKHAIAALGELNHHESYKEIQSILEQADTDDFVKTACIGSLLKINNTIATPYLIERFSHFSPVSQEITIAYFGKEKCWGAVRFLLDLINSPSDSVGLDLQFCAINCLTILKEHQVANNLCKLVNDDTRPVDLRTAAARSLGKFKGMITPSRLEALAKGEHPMEVTQGLASALLEIQRIESQR